MAAIAKDSHYNFHEYLIQHSLKPGGTKDHIRQVKVPGTVPY
jgi:hypothetical protein